MPEIGMNAALTSCPTSLHASEGSDGAGAAIKTVVPSSRLGHAAALIMCVLALRLIVLSSNNATRDGARYGVQRSLGGGGVAQHCPALRYAKMTCPVWDGNQPEGGDGVDARVKWIYRNQNPQDCGSVNYLIRALTQRIGFGASLMLDMEALVYIAMHSDRLFLLDTDLPFRYAACPEKDWSCYFEPLSRCTVQDAEQIVEARGGVYDQRVFNKTHRVIRTQRLAAEIPGASPWAWHKRTPDRPWWNNLALFPGHEEVVAGGLLYALRPNQKVRKLVEELLHDVFSGVCDFDPERTISMPIRGSDKCMGAMHVGGGMDGENDCFESLEKYMEIAEQIREYDSKVDTIILTSEDERYLNDTRRYEQNGRWRFVFNNRGDAVKGTGTIDVMEKRPLEQVFTSFFSTLHVQLRGKYFVLNCASNYHRLMRTLVKHGGCAFVTNPVVYCLDEQYADFRVCLINGYDDCVRAREEEVRRKQEALRTRVES